MRAALAAAAMLAAAAVSAAGQYNSPYVEEGRQAPQAQELDEGARARLREALMFDYAHCRHRRNAGIALGAAGVATYALGVAFAATWDMSHDSTGDGDALHGDGGLVVGLSLALAGMTAHAVGVPMAIVNGVRMGRARRQYMSRLNRSIDYDYRRLRRRVFFN